MPVGPLRVAKMEAFSRNLAKGLSQTEAAREAGYSPNRSPSTGSTLAKHPKVIARVKELTERIDNQFARLVLIDKSSILQSVVSIVNIAVQEKKYGDALKGLEMLGKNMRLWDRAMETIGWNGDPSTLTDEQLEVLGSYLERIAYNGDPEKIAAAKKRALIEAQKEGLIIDTTAELVVENKEIPPDKEW